MSNTDTTKWMGVYSIQQLFSISWREQVNVQWDDDKVSLIPDQHAELNFDCASALKQHSAGRHVAPLGNIILIPRQPQSLLFLLNAAYSTEKHHNFIVFVLTRPGFEPTIYRAWSEHVNHYATDAIPHLVKWCSQENVFYVRVKWKPSHTTGWTVENNRTEHELVCM